MISSLSLFHEGRKGLVAFLGRVDGEDHTAVAVAIMIR